MTDPAKYDLDDFRRYADDLPLFVWMQRPDGFIEWANRAWYDYVRLPEPIATTAEGWAQVVHPDDFQSVVDAFGRAIVTQTAYEQEHRVRPADGDESTYRWVLARSTPRFGPNGELTYWIGTGIDIDDSKMLARQASESFRVMGDAVPQMMWSAQSDGAIDWYNGRWYDYTGQTREEAAGWGWQAVHHPEDLPAVMQAWPVSIATGQPFEMEFRLRGADGRFRWFLTRAMPVRDGAGRITRWYGTNTDIDAERRLRARDAFFARVGEALALALSLDDTLQAVTRLVVPEFADWALVNLIDGEGRITLGATYHRDPLKHVKAAALRGRQYGLDASDTGSAAVIRTGRPRLYPSVTREAAAQTVVPEVLDTFLEMGLGSIIIVPLLHAGEAVGTLSVVRGTDRPAYGEDDVPFFEELARRIAPALGNAASYEREKRIAQTFQRAALHAALPAVPGLVFDAIYEAGRTEALVGGDWYDAFRLGDGRIVLSVGDVAGSGLDAAVTMGSLRQSIRTAALINPDPVAVLDSVDRIVRAMGNDRFVTAFVGVLDPVHRELSYASAGHPPALLVQPGGTVVVLDHGDLPLGLRQRSAQRASGMLLEPGSLLVLYTDGLTEFERDPLAGEAQVGAAARAVTEAGGAARSVYDAIVRGESPHDDVAILTVAVESSVPSADLADWAFDARDALAARTTRYEFVERLAAAGLAEDELAAAELVFGELLGNVVRYALGEVRITLDTRGELPVLHVLDEGAGFEHSARLPSDPMQENGRGLFIVSAVADEFTVARRVAGGSHARAVLTGRIRNRARSAAPVS